MTTLQTLLGRKMTIDAGSTRSFPADIEARRIQLESLLHVVGTHARVMDGWLFGYVGVDAAVSLIPVVGDVASGLMTLWLLSKARQARMRWSDQLMMLAIGVADVSIGMVPVVGDVVDVFFRAHAWNAQRVQAHVLEQLRQIEFARGGSGHDAVSLEPLRDQLFRGGRTRAEVWSRRALALVLSASLMAYCTLEAQLRHEQILACEATGKWFCSLLN